MAQDENQMLENMLRTLLQQLVVCLFCFVLSTLLILFFVCVWILGVVVQASAAQSGEQIMQYGQLIDDKNINGQIPRLLG